ncbi:MAG: methyltransferase domain-containing protein [Candidatus Latescibacterota bacterium]
MTRDATPPGPANRLTDYREHYTADAESIMDPGDLPPARAASEGRRVEALVRLLRPHAGERLLDMGCGSGWLAERCQAAGGRVWAADLARLGVTRARRRYPAVAHFQVADAYHLPFAASSFDAVVLSEVVEHLEDVGAALAQACRVLRPGGRLLVSVPFRETILYHLCIHCNRLTPAHAHLHSFDRETLAACLAAQGLRVLRTEMLGNRLLELAAFPWRTRGWPHALWRAADRLLNRLVPRPAFMAVLAVRPAQARDLG